MTGAPHTVAVGTPGGPPVSLAVMRTLVLAVLLWASGAAAQERTIVILPLGKVDKAFLDAAAAAVRERLTVPVRIDPPREVPKAAWYPPRKRWRAERILDAVERDLPEGAWRVLVVTSVEISTTKGDIKDWGIAGLGNIGGPSCVASTFLYTRHSKSKALALKRFADVAVHEFGHTLGLPHCETTGCVMADAKGKAMKSADRSRGHYCLGCRQRVEAGVLKAWPTP